MGRSVCMFQNICSCLFVRITTVCQDTCLIQIGVDLLIDVVTIGAARNLGYRQCLMLTEAGGFKIFRNGHDIRDIPVKECVLEFRSVIRHLPDGMIL